MDSRTKERDGHTDVRTVGGRKIDRGIEMEINEFTTDGRVDGFA